MQKLAMRDSGKWSIFSGNGSYQYSGAFSEEIGRLFSLWFYVSCKCRKKGKENGIQHECPCPRRAGVAADLSIAVIFSGQHDHAYPPQSDSSVHRGL